MGGFRDGGFVCSPAGVLGVPIAVPWECVQCPTAVVCVGTLYLLWCVVLLCNPPSLTGPWGSRSVE